MAEKNSMILPLGRSSFEGVRSHNCIYVDKTDLINQFAGEGGYYFLCRPRRFGKTLLVDTLASLFKYGLRDFQGLKIEDQWSDHTYDVLRLDFSDIRQFTSIEEFDDKFTISVGNAMEAAGIQLSPRITDMPDNFIAQFGRTMTSRPVESLVLLIDEYDAPLIDCLNNPTLFTKVQKHLLSFFDTVKKVSACLHFMFITGISRYSNVGIFSAFNILQDLSMDPAYGTLLGYTEEEIRFYFKDHLSHAADVLNLSVDECIAKLKENYDGFCFDEDVATHVFNPWSVLYFLKNPKRGFANYWYNSSGNPSILLNYLKGHCLKDPAHYGNDQVVNGTELTSSKDINKLSDLVMLYQSGYLTLKAKSVLGNRYTLNYPNRELALSMAQLYAENLPEEGDLVNFGMIFLNFSQENFVNELNAFIGKMSYERFPLKDEYSIQSLLYLALRAAGFSPDIEVKNAHGRSDLELRAANRYFVLELKYAREDQDADKLLDAAVEQIKSRHYGEYNHPKLEHVRIALVFSQQQRAFVKWTILDKID